MLETLLRWLVRLLFAFRSYDLAALTTPGPVLLLPNHVSWLDWIFIGVCLDGDWRFVTSSTTAELSWVHKFIMVNRRTFPVDMTSPYAVKRMAEYLQSGGRLVLFPEGRISTTGSLMKLFDGTGFLILKTRAKVITAYIRGGHHLPFSRNPDPKQWFPRVSVHFSELLAPPALGQISVTEARIRLTDWLRDQMVRQRFETEMKFGAPTVPQAIAETARRLPRKKAVQDVTLHEVSYKRLMVGARTLASLWQTRLYAPVERVGLLLPNVNAFPVVLQSVWMAGKVPAVLNYTHGLAILLACARLAGLRQIITSQAFVARFRLDLKPLQEAGIEFIFLEEVRKSISPLQKLAAALNHLVDSRLSRLELRPDSSAVILFTSGSEGDPKGVELTHANLLANIRQMCSVIDLMDQDRFFTALPLFHSFGLSIGLLLPLVQGAFICLYLSPLHYRVVPAAFNNLNCTVFFGTNTFLAGYARKAHPNDFRTLRYLFAGAEKIQQTTTTTWMQRFGVRVMEGYGATECSPCLSANLPMRPRQGSAGQFLPGIEYRLEHVEGVGNESAKNTGPDHEAPPGIPPNSALRTSHSALRVGRLFVRGPNVMRGYLNPEANGRFQALGGWYDTGDIVRVDAEGFVYILGRLKRFAKVSGEMVSLTAVEDALASSFPQYGLHFGVAVLARPDEAKGEKLIVATNEPRLTLDAVRDAVRTRGLGNLSVPREVRFIRELPRLGTGKINHRELEKMV